MIYGEAQVILRFGSTILKPKHYLHNLLLHMEVLYYKSEKRHPISSIFFFKFFGDFVKYFCQAMGIELKVLNF